MTRRTLSFAILLLACAATIAGPVFAATGTPASRLAPFFRRLQSSGRAEVRIVRRPLDASDSEGSMRGRVRLEPPDRVRLDFDGGESVTLRSDGGEWLEPRLKQLVRLDRDRAGAALAWWDLLLGRDREAFSERVLGRGRILIVRHFAGGASDSARVTLDPRGMPARLEIGESGGLHAVIDLRGWRFSAARGWAEFKLAAPSGFEVVDLP